MSAQDALRTGVTAGAQSAPRPAGPESGDLAPGLSVADTDTSAGQIPAASGSPLSQLRERREAASRELYLDLEVPRMGGIWVRYRPVGSVEINAITDRVQNTARIDKHRKPLVANAALLAAACLGITEADELGYLRGDPSSWPRFGPDLREMLGKSEAECPNAADVVEALYLTQGDLMAAAVQLTEWSMEESGKRDQKDAPTLGG